MRMRKKVRQHDEIRRKGVEGKPRKSNKETISGMDYIWRDNNST